MVRTAFLLLATLFASVAYAQEDPPFVVQISPEAPTSATPVTVFVTRVGGCPTEFVGRTGNTLLVRQTEICVMPPSNTDEFLVGLLPVGTYTVRIEYSDDNGPQVFTSTFAVAAAATPEAPTLEVYGAIALALMLAVVAMQRA
jgi:hypothetical protein